MRSFPQMKAATAKDTALLHKAKSKLARCCTYDTAGVIIV
jgi:hypothetical protein